MNEAVDLGQRYVAALWDALNTHIADPGAAAARLGAVIASTRDVEAQLAGLRLRAMHEASLSGAAAVLDEAQHSVSTTVGEATAMLKLSNSGNGSRRSPTP